MVISSSKAAPPGHSTVTVNFIGTDATVSAVPERLDKWLYVIAQQENGKVEVVADPEIEAVFPKLQRVIVTIHTTEGEQLKEQLDYPKGDPRNPLTDAEIEEKFDALAAPVLSADARTRLKKAVWDLEKLQTVTELLDLCRADR